MTDGGPPLKTIQRAFRIVEILKSETALGVTDLARRMDLPKSTVHDYVRSLRRMGYVVKDGGQYRLSLRFLELGEQLKYRNRLFHVARSELERLVGETGELASVNVEERGRFVILDTEFGDESLQIGIYPGFTIPIHSHAAGKVMLAGFDDEKVDRIVDRHGLEPVTQYTVTDRGELDAELEAIRERGYAMDRNQQVVGMAVVAAPIEADDEVIGSIGIVCPTDRLDDDHDKLAHETQKSANIVSVNYQYPP